MPGSNSFRPALWRLASALGVGLLLGLLLWPPPEAMRWALRQALGPKLVLVGLQGSGWHGHAQWAWSAPDGTAPVALPGRVHWHWQQQGLGVVLAWRADCCMRETAQLRWSLTAPSTLQVQWPESHWPLAWLRVLGAPWNTLSLEGQLLLSPASAQLGPAGLQINAPLQAQVQALRSALVPRVDLGHYTLQWRPGASAQTPELWLDTRQGPLQMRGQGRLLQGRWQFRGEAFAEPGHEALLANLLQIIGRKQGERTILSLG